MPEYKFKCKKCKRVNVLEFPLRIAAKAVPDWDIGECKKCGDDLKWSDIQIEFAGGINMNSSDVGVARRKYSNKGGGPKPIIDGKIRNDLKMPTAV